MLCDTTNARIIQLINFVHNTGNFLAANTLFTGIHCRAMATLTPGEIATIEKSIIIFLSYHDVSESLSYSESLLEESSGAELSDSDPLGSYIYGAGIKDVSLSDELEGLPVSDWSLPVPLSSSSLSDMVVYIS